LLSAERAGFGGGSTIAARAAAQGGSLRAGGDALLQIAADLDD
jgi:hypothetical protein